MSCKEQEKNFITTKPKKNGDSITATDQKYGSSITGEEKEYGEVTDNLKNNEENQNLKEKETNKAKHMSMVAQMSSIMSQLDDLDVHISELSANLEKVDHAIMDISHYVEFNKFSLKSSYYIINMFHELRVLRREIKDEIEISDVFNQHRQKIINDGNRQMLMNEVYKKEKKLNERVYGYRVLDEEFIKQCMKGGMFNAKEVLFSQDR